MNGLDEDRAYVVIAMMFCAAMGFLFGLFLGVGWG